MPVARDYLFAYRISLKRLLFSQRSVLVKPSLLIGFERQFYNTYRYPRKGMLPLCALCGKHLNGNGGEMHEALITRGEVMGTDLMTAIMVRENCVILHPLCHRKAHTSENRIKCAEYLLQWELKEVIDAWIERISAGYTLPTEVNDAKRFVELAFASAV